MSAHASNVADIRWKGPGGEMDVIEFSLTDELSSLARMMVILKSDEKALDFTQLLRADAKLILMVGEKLEEERDFTGIITHIEQKRTGHGALETATTKSYLYEMEIRPAMWLLTKKHRSKVHQDKSVVDIVTELMDEVSAKHDWKLNGSYQPRDFVIQFDEPDFQFVNRLLEDEGIYYFYDHKEKKTIFTDDPGQHVACVPFDSADYLEGGGVSYTQAKQEYIEQLSYHHQIGSGKFEVNDYNYETSAINLKKDNQDAKKPAEKDLEVYTHGVAHKTPDDADKFSKLRMEEGESGLIWIDGMANCRSFATGFTFDLKKHYRDELNKKWLLSRIDIRADQGYFMVRFQAMPADVVFRPKRVTPKPKIYGLQTAKITGPSGAEVYLDEMGRCKLQFHWDREGPGNDRSSIWVRVSNGYAGKDYGIQWIPRVGHEVLVQFIDGNPDRPLVVGRVYNDLNTAPLKPANKWQNIIKTIKDNHIMFDDEDGKELVDIRAQKNMNTLVLNDQTLTVGNNQTNSIGEDRKTSVGGDQTLDVTHDFKQSVGGDKGLSVGGDLEESITGDHTHTVNGDHSVGVNGDQETSVVGDRTASIIGDDMISVGGDLSQVTGGNTTITSGQAISMMAGTSFTISCGACSFSMSPGGINISMGANSVSINPAMVAINGVIVKLN